MGDTDGRVIRLRVQPLWTPNDLRREARRLERLRAARAATPLPAPRAWPGRDPDDDPKEAA